MPIKISNAEVFFFFEIGKIKKASSKAKPKCIALAGKPLNIPKLKINGKGEAYHSWNKDQIIAMAATIFKCIPVRFFVGDKSSLILLSTSVLIFWFIIKTIPYYKKKAQWKLGLFKYYYKFGLH